MLNKLATFLIIICIDIILSKDEDNIDLDKQEIPINKEIYSALPGKRVSSKEQLLDIHKMSDITFFGFFFKKDSKNSFIISNFLPTIYGKLENLADFILIDCDESNNFSECEGKDEYFPRMVVFIPPQYKINPYTKKESTYSQISFSDGEVSETILYNFITKYIQSKGIKLSSENFKQIISNPSLNKVLLFTDKPQSGLIFKGLSGWFHDRIIFGEVHKEETGLSQKYEVKKYPTLIVVETLEEDLQTLRDEPEVHVYTGNLKAKDISVFLEKFALKTKLYLSNEGKQSSEEFSKEKIVSSLFKKIKGDALVKYFEKHNRDRLIIWVNKGEEVTEEMVNFSKKTNGFFHFIQIDCTQPEYSFFCVKVKKTPQLLLVQDLGLSWDQRISKSIGIKGINNYKDIIEEIKSEIEGKVKGLTKDNFQAETFKVLSVEKKLPCVHFFKDELDIVLHLISSEDEANETLQFFGFLDPPKELISQFGITTFPSTFIIAPDPRNPESAQLMPYIEELIYSKFKQVISQISNKKAPEKKEEKKLIHVEDLNTLEKECINKRKACFIGLLDGRDNNLVNYNRNKQTLDDLVSKSQDKPYTYLHLNATCHDEILRDFQINIDSLPTAIIYIPAKDIYTIMIGTFDSDSINSFMNKVINGRVAMQNITKDKFKLESKDCSLIKEEIIQDEDDDVLKEMLAEIAKKEEEERLAKEQEAKNKKNKKKKKNNKKEDL